MKQSKVAGYTILEMVIAMLITGIVIAMAWSVFSLVLRSFDAYQSKHNDTEQLTRLNILLQKDFYKATIITRDSGGIRLLTDTTSVRYELDSSFIVRHTVVTDTFKFQVTDPVFTMNSVPVANEPRMSEEEKRIDHFNVTILFNKRAIPYFYDKKYSSQDLINRTDHAEH